MLPDDYEFIMDDKLQALFAIPTNVDLESLELPDDLELQVLDKMSVDQL